MSRIIWIITILSAAVILGGLAILGTTVYFVSQNDEESTTVSPVRGKVISY